MVVSQIQQFYKNQTIFVTGTTGLLGKLLLRKLLLSCDVKKIYVLLRPKKGKTVEERLDKLLESYCFVSLRDEKPEFRSKIVIVEGDCQSPDLGLTEQDTKLLQDEVTSIIHIAATVKFDEKLKISGTINVRGVRDLLKLAKTIKNLKVFVHVSTAYSNCNQKDHIEEKFYKSPMPSDVFLKLLELDEDFLEAMQDKLLGDWPNTYTFSKAIAEDVIRQEGQNLPIAIVRPGIILGPVEEPETGWVDIPQGLMALSLGFCVGLVHCVLLNVKKKTAIVPMDYVVNNVLAAGWETHTKTRTTPIYNMTGSHKNFITWGMFKRYGVEGSKRVPSVAMIWKVFVITTPYKFLYKFYRFWLSDIPAHAVDIILKLVGKKPRLVKLYTKINKGVDVLAPFSLNGWFFENKNTEDMWRSMNESDKTVFPFNMDGLDWNDFFMKSAAALRKFLLNDPLHTLPQGQRKQIKLEVLHYVTVGLYALALFFLIRFVFKIFLWFF